ncbi:P-loop containing nucleoside triphosphate hydrolase protein [Mycena galopus ATCC 62051]|nr:P-loop containing nucleoside triphosphate hydrolase protein [Mycena galopus ATCC 62051]
MFQLPRRRGTNSRSNTTTTNGNNTNGAGTSGRNGSPGSATGDGTSTSRTTISSSDYALRCRELMTLDKDLRALGANTLFDLPSITVIGGQSAGKSSLVEAVSGINVPRDSGTCTRCPMECVMSSSADSWSCNISLRFDYDSSGAKKETETKTFGPTITDKRAVELWLRRAQAAILSPLTPPQDFYTKTVQELRNPPVDAERLPFSKNAVLVYLCDPDITDLSFVDLPGLIQNEAADVIEVVRDLAVSRINNSNTLILVTIPMSDDIQNQQAARLAKDADPAGERTIAVLTKPDILGPGATGSRQKWKDILEGRDQPLKHGYHCVRLPDDAERSRAISRAESERFAAEYFDSNQPWQDIADRSRFGVPNLATFLSKLLIDRIESYLPTLRRQVEGLLAKYNSDLLQLPPPPTSEPTAEVLLRISAFCNAFHAAVFADENKNVAQSNRRIYLRFKADIRSTSPDFRPFAGYSNYQNPNITDAESIDVGASTTGACAPAIEPQDLVSVRQIIAHSIGWELPNHVPFDATRTLVLKFTDKWRSASITCFSAVVEASADFLERLTVTHFSQFTRLEKYIGTLIRAELEVCKDHALETLEKMLALEKLPLFTQNTHQFQTESKAWFTRYNTVRHHWSSYRLGVLPPNTPLVPQALMYQGEEYAEELVLMANVRAYWQIAYQRIIDYVPLLIEHEFNQRLAARLQEMLFENILEGPDARARMQDLLKEDTNISVQRNLLEARIVRLGEIKQKLDGLS